MLALTCKINQLKLYTYNDVVLLNYMYTYIWIFYTCISMSLDIINTVLTLMSCTILYGDFTIHVLNDH